MSIQINDIGSRQNPVCRISQSYVDLFTHLFGSLVISDIEFKFNLQNPGFKI
jgi:hypothetical protein